METADPLSPSCPPTPSCLPQKNHLSGIQRKLLKVSFWNQDQLMQVRREVQPIVSRNRYRRDGTSAYALLAEQQRPAAGKAGKERLQDALESIVEMREHDVPYHVRFAIDTDVRCGHWFTVKAKVGGGGGGRDGWVWMGGDVRAGGVGGAGGQGGRGAGGQGGRGVCFRQADGAQHDATAICH